MNSLVPGYRKVNLIKELSLMQVPDLLQHIEKLTRHRNKNLRFEAQLSMISLKGFNGLAFLEDYPYDIPYLHQLVFLEKMAANNNSEHMDPGHWLASSNATVVSLGLKYCRRFQYFMNEEQLLPLLEHPNPQVINEAVQTIGSFGYTSALDNIKALVAHPEYNIQLAALQCLKAIGSSDDIPFLEATVETETTKMVQIEILKLIHTFNPAYSSNNPVFQQYIKKV